MTEEEKQVAVDVREMVISLLQSGTPSDIVVNMLKRDITELTKEPEPELVTRTEVLEIARELSSDYPSRFDYAERFEDIDKDLLDFILDNGGQKLKIKD